MKIMTCKQLGGACDLEFEAETWEQMQKLSQEHGKEMVASGDPDHLSAMQKMRSLMQNPSAMRQWLENKRKEFEEPSS